MDKMKWMKEPEVRAAKALMELGNWFFHNAKKAKTALWKQWPSAGGEFPFGDLEDSEAYSTQESPEQWWDDSDSGDDSDPGWIPIYKQYTGQPPLLFGGGEK